MDIRELKEQLPWIRSDKTMCPSCEYCWDDNDPDLADAIESLLARNELLGKVLDAANKVLGSRFISVDGEKVDYWDDNKILLGKAIAACDQTRQEQ